MTDLLNQALEAVHQLPSDRQDAIACAMLVLAREVTPVELTREERAAIVLSKAAAARGEFASDEEMQELWATYGL